MQEILKRQTKTLESLERIASADRLIQLVQAKESIDSENQQEGMKKELEQIGSLLKRGLLNKTGDGLNSNMIKMLVRIDKALTGPRALSNQEVRGISETAAGRRIFNTGKIKAENIKESAKDLFTVRGFLDKTGIAKRGSGGLFSEYLDRADEKKKYIESRAKIDGDSKQSRKAYGKQFDKQQEIQFDISRNERELKKYRDQGFTEEQIFRTPESKKQRQLATDLAKVDTRVRPKGFDRLTGLVKSNGSNSIGIEDSNAAGAFVAPMTSTDSSEESMLEQNRMISDQTELLSKIEENTRPGNKIEQKQPEPAKESSGGGLLDMLGGGKRLGGIAKSAGKGLLSAGKGLARFALPAAAAFAATNAIDFGLGKLGIGKTESGEDIAIDKEKDDANWKKMSTGQKIGSGVARGLEKVGSFIGFENLSRAAEAKRIESESAYFEKLKPTAAGEPQTGNLISKQSGENEQAKLDSQKNSGGNTSVVSAPTINNNQSTTNIKAPIRNQESSQSQYLRNRYVA